MSWQSIVLHIIFWTTFYYIIRYDLLDYITERAFYYGVLFILTINIILKLIPKRKDERVVFTIKAKDKWYDTGALFYTLIPIYLIGNVAKGDEKDIWLVFQHWPYLVLSIVLYLVFQLYTQADVVERQLEIDDQNIYFVEAKSTYYAPIEEFDKIKISYNKISAIAKDGRKDRLGGYKMTDGDILNLIAFLKKNVQNIELDVYYGKTA